MTHDVVMETREVIAILPAFALITVATPLPFEFMDIDRDAPLKKLRRGETHQQHWKDQRPQHGTETFASRRFYFILQFGN